MRYWLIYDLGLQGHYDELFAWLDQHKAKECGDNVATFVSNKSRQGIVKEIATILIKRKIRESISSPVSTAASSFSENGSLRRGPVTHKFRLIAATSDEGNLRRHWLLDWSL
jgi:hypothetical protein